MKRYYKGGFLVSVLLHGGSLVAREVEKEPITCRGNLSLRSAQQPGAMFAFGQNTLDKGDTTVSWYLSYARGRNKHASEGVFSYLYGITDKLSIFIAVPIAFELQEDEDRSSGFKDASVALEYIFYSKEIHECAAATATIVGSINLPSGSDLLAPVTGSGSPAFFGGFTYSYTSEWWYFFLTQGVLLSTRHCNNKPGNQFFYQTGLGGNIADPPGWIHAWVVEFDGLATGNAIVNGVEDPCSSSNVIQIAPSIWSSNDFLRLQAGIAIPIVQKVSEGTNKDHYLISFGVAVTF